jgi:hypothetical protein
VITDSHGLSLHFGSRQFGAYYLGCPMTHRMKTSYLDLVRQMHHGRSSSYEAQVRFGVKKVNFLDSDDLSCVISIHNYVTREQALHNHNYNQEDLIVIDPDLAVDYHPEGMTWDWETILRPYLPRHVRIVLAQVS